VVAADEGFAGAAAVFGLARGDEVPFHVGLAGDEGDVGEVVDLWVVGTDTGGVRVVIYAHITVDRISDGAFSGLGGWLAV